MRRVSIIVALLALAAAGRLSAQYIDPGGGLPPYYCYANNVGNVHYIPQRARLMQCDWSLAWEIPGGYSDEYGNIMGCLGGPNYPYGPCYLWHNY
jgi:hypothetical protein